jgi:hypothetical protein
MCLGMVTTLSMSRGQSLDANFTYPGGPLWNGVSLADDKPSI